MDETAKYTIAPRGVVFELGTDPPRTATISADALEKITGVVITGRDNALAAYKLHAELIHRVATAHPGLADGNVTLRAFDF